MAQKPHKRKRAVIIMIAALALSALVVWLGIYAPGKARRIAINSITSAVERQLGEPYRVTLHGMHLRLWDGAISIEHTAVEVDSMALDSLTSIGLRPATLFAGTSGRIEVAVRLPRKGALRIKYINIERPHIEVMRDSTFVADTLRAAKMDTATLRLPFSDIVVGQVNIDRGHFSVTRQRTEGTSTHRLTGIHLRVEQMALRDGMPIRELHLPAMDNLSCRIDSTTHSPIGRDFDLTVKHLRLSLPKGEIEADSIELLPRHDPSQFAHLTGRDWMKASAGKVIGYGIDPRALIDGQGLRCDSVVIITPAIESYKNRQAPVPLKVKPLLQQMVQRMVLPIDVPLVRIADGKAVYRELPPTGTIAGVIAFDQVALRIDSLSNIPGRSRDFHIHSSARVAERGRLEAVVTLPVDSLRSDFTIVGTMHGMDMEGFNTMMVPLAHIKVAEGRLRRMDFNIAGDAKRASIDMQMEYSGLKIDVQDKDGARSWLGSILVNSLVVVGDNPPAGKELQNVHATATRDPYRSNFNYWWRITFAGVKPSIGLTTQKQLQLSNLQEQFKQMKHRREERRAERK